jgi:hypothetical protein
MSRFKWLLTVLVLVPAVLGAGRLFGTTRYRQYSAGSSGVQYNGSWDQPNDNGDQYRAEFCLARCFEVLCIYCHTSNRDRSKEVYTAAKHEKTYLPQFAVQPQEGYKVPWGQYGGHLQYKNKQWAYLTSDGKLNMTAALGSILLHDRIGKPFVLHMPADPTIK